VTQRYKKCSIIREVFAKKAFAYHALKMSQAKIENRRPKNGEVFENKHLKTSQI
jgi:hypothetical protein